MELIKEKSIVLKSKNELFTNIKKVLNLNENNMKLQKKLNEKFMKKGIDNSTIFALFRGDMEIEQLEKDNIRLICLCEGIVENITPDYLYQHNINVSINEYFTDKEFLVYQMYQKREEEIITTLELKNVTRINKYEYTCYISVETLSKWRKSGLPKYNGDVQRPLEYTINSKGETIQKISINKKNLLKLKNRFKMKDEKGKPFRDDSKELISTDIYFFSVLEEGKEPLFRWDGDEKAGSIGNLTITPIFDYVSDNYCPLIIADGFHRLTASCDAFDEMEKEGKYLDKGFTVHFILADIKRAKQFVSDTFERTDIKSTQKEAITSSPKNEALNVLISKCNILRNNVSNTYEDNIGRKTRTYRTVLLKALDYTNIDFTKVYKTDTRMTKIAKIINNIFEFYKENNILSGNLYASGMFSGYIAIANTMLELEDSVNLSSISSMCENLIEIDNNNVLDDYNLDNKAVKVKELYKFLENFTMEVMQNEG